MAIARLMQTDFLTTVVEETDTDTLSKGLTGTLPLLQLQDGTTTISNPISISRVLSNNKLGFYGPEISDKARIDEWIDIISLTVVPTSTSLMR